MTMTFTNAVTETARMLPRLALVTLLLAGTATMVSRVNAASDAGAGFLLAGQDIKAPSGVGFVLAVGLQRAR